MGTDAGGCPESGHAALRHRRPRAAPDELAAYAQRRGERPVLDARVAGLMRASQVASRRRLGPPATHRGMLVRVVEVQEVLLAPLRT